MVPSGNVILPLLNIPFESKFPLDMVPFGNVTLPLLNLPFESKVPSDIVPSLNVFIPEVICPLTLSKVHFWDVPFSQDFVPSISFPVVVSYFPSVMMPFSFFIPYSYLPPLPGSNDHEGLSSVLLVCHHT